MSARTSAKSVVVVLLAGVFAAPLLAQASVPASDPTMAAKGYANVGSPNAPAVNAQEAPVTAGLNDQVGQAAAANTAANADAQAQYQADRDAYMAALVQHDAAVNRTDMRYVRQQRAYADAMAAWRIQVQACKHGHQRACNAPPPNVADYY